MAAAALISPPSSYLCYYSSSIRDVRACKGSKTASAARQLATVFATGAPLLNQKSFYRRSTARKSRSVSIKCEQSSKESSSGLDIWVGRLAMVSFAAAISVEIATGKGLLENFGLTTPLPTVALAATAVVGALTAVFIFRSVSKN